MTGAPNHFAFRAFNAAIMVVGGLALAWMMHSLGWDQVQSVLAGVGSWFAVIIALDLVAMGCDAQALHLFMRPEARMVSYWRVLAAQASGRAINVLTPGGGLGEVTKLTMLVSHVPRARVLSSLVLANVASLYLSVAVMLVGTPITMLLVHLPHYVEVMVVIGLGVLVPLMIGVAIVIHRGATRTIVAGLRRVNIISVERAERWKPKLAEIDRHIAELQRDRSAGTWQGIAWVVASKLIAWAAMLVVLHALDVVIHVKLVIALVSVGVLIQWISSIVPLGLGVADAANYALFDLLGATGAHGMLMTLLNRARSLAVAIIGLGFMAVMHVLDRIVQLRIRRKVRALRDDVAAGME